MKAPSSSSFSSSLIPFTLRVKILSEARPSSRNPVGKQNLASIPRPQPHTPCFGSQGSRRPPLILSYFPFQKFSLSTPHSLPLHFCHVVSHFLLVGGPGIVARTRIRVHILERDLIISRCGSTRNATDDHSPLLSLDETFSPSRLFKTGQQIFFVRSRIRFHLIQFTGEDVSSGLQVSSGLALD